MTRYIDADALKHKAQKMATEAWKMKLTAKIETILNQFIDWIDEMPTIDHIAEDSKKVASSCSHENGKDVIYRQDTIDALFELYEYQMDIDPTETADLVRQGIFLAEKKIEKLPSAQPDVITASLEELIKDYGEDGYFIVDGVNYQANELLNELKINSSVGEKFRKKITKTIVQYFMKFGG